MKMLMVARVAALSRALALFKWLPGLSGPPCRCKICALFNELAKARVFVRSLARFLVEFGCAKGGAPLNKRALVSSDRQARAKTPAIAS